MRGRPRPGGAGRRRRGRRGRGPGAGPRSRGAERRCARGRAPGRRRRRRSSRWSARPRMRSIRARVSSLRWQAARIWWKGTPTGSALGSAARRAAVGELERGHRHVATDDRREVVRRAPGAHHRVEHGVEHALHHRAEELLAVAEVDVERAAREAGARADRVEAREVEALLRELGDRGLEQRLAGLLLGELAGGLRRLRTGRRPPP